MKRPEEQNPHVIAFAQGITLLWHSEPRLTPLEATVGLKLALEAVVDETGAPAALLHMMRTMLDEIERDRQPETFTERVVPYPVEQWRNKTA